MLTRLLKFCQSGIISENLFTLMIFSFWFVLNSNEALIKN